MDSAATALEAGAAHVHLLVRRADLPRINKGKGAGNPGFVQGYARLPDDWKWRIRHYINTQQVPPPRNSTQRVSRHANAHFHLGVAIEGAVERGGALQVRTSAGPIELDFLIFATGFKVDWRQRPMLRHIAPCIRVWKDRYAPPAGDEDDELAESPDLGARVRVPAARGRALPGPRARALPHATRRRSRSASSPATSRRSAKARCSSPTRWPGCCTPRTSSTTTRAWRRTTSPRSSATNGSPSRCRPRRR